MLYALTWEQAQKYVPPPLAIISRPATRPMPQPTMPVKPAVVTALPPIITGGEREKTAWTHVPDARRPRNKQKPPRIRKEKRLLRRRSLRLR